ncbi:PTS sugar transporter subunit IIA [Vagococcus elongatus]|uniref:PTS fructose transporter subunit IIA n=1 Tax=Vagococcus elongatus TaxID=180344 RepID=A0A430AQI0_9ENTE|nr:fructose PTS transporter subunit IIA [Vagococcus elongatus]RSU10157.1 PTS fructose transporter subunit IIA [Vagococcus elongatus]
MEVITRELVDLNLEATSVKEVVLSLGERIESIGRLSNFDGYIDSVMEREELTSTGIGFGIAIPHGKSEHVTSCTVAFARLTSPIEWESLDEQPVKIVFLLAVPEACKGDEHLKIIAALSRKLIHEDFRQQLETLEDEQELVEMINETLANAITK